MKKVGLILSEAFNMLFSKPVTEQYPFEKAHIEKSFRGKLVFFPEKCIGCKLCMKDCPANAICINKIGEKKFEAILSMDHCVYCAQCVDSCPKKALEISPNFELAAIDRKYLKVSIDEKKVLIDEKPVQNDKQEN
ncbi:MAG: 4Fe-4S binding protein [Candidatus Riflebacteria bacterium]|nr:4Fe-4S binding protein [Candidatus Riflebacteria bacterium]